jgi:ribosomal protein S18 acetylase RimI-like enzyme
MRIRDARPKDAEFMHAMSLAAMSWTGDGSPMAVPELAPYLQEWGLAGDTGVIAEDPSPLGAAWYRFISGYGFVADDVPELGIAVAAAYRGRGVGRMLMDALIGRARATRLRGLSLSVEDGNERASQLYASLGFIRLHRNGNAWTMVLWLP